MSHHLALISERHPATSRQFCLLLLIQYVKDHFALADIGNEQTVVLQYTDSGRPKPPERDILETP